MPAILSFIAMISPFDGKDLDGKDLALDMQEPAFDRDEPFLVARQLLGGGLILVVGNAGCFEGRVSLCQHQGDGSFRDQAEDEATTAPTLSILSARAVTPVSTIGRSRSRTRV